MLETLEITRGEPIDAAVIWLHGLGADGHDFEPIVDELELPRAIRFVFPHAPVRPVTINGGQRMRAWYDISSLGPGGPEDEAGIRASAAEIGALIDREQSRGLESARIVLAGFSQGGAVALHTALREPRRLAGVLALSTYLPLADTLHTERAIANRHTPILLAHGRLDPVIPFRLAEASRDRLLAEGYAVEWRSYEMPHSVCLEEIQDIADWLGRLSW